MNRINLRTFFVKESTNNKKDRRNVNIRTKYSIKGSKVQSVAECDNSLNLRSSISDNLRRYRESPAASVWRQVKYKFSG